MLYQLKRAGISHSDLITVYRSVVRPVGICLHCVAHTYLQQYLSDKSKRYRKERALICIFRGARYADKISNVGLQTLKERRDFIGKKTIFQQYENTYTQISSSAAP